MTCWRSRRLCMRSFMMKMDTRGALAPCISSLSLSIALKHKNGRPSTHACIHSPTHKSALSRSPCLCLSTFFPLTQRPGRKASEEQPPAGKPPSEPPRKGEEQAAKEREREREARILKQKQQQDKWREERERAAAQREAAKACKEPLHLPKYGIWIREPGMRQPLLM